MKNAMKVSFITSEIIVFTQSSITRKFAKISLWSDFNTKLEKHLIQSQEEGITCKYYYEVNDKNP